MRKRYIRYVAILLAIVLGPAALYLVFGFAFVIRTNELGSVGAFADRSIAEPSIYNSLGARLREYKEEMYRRAAPEITVLGSSRSMQFRSYMFDGSFYSLSGLMRGVADFEDLSQTTLAEHRPRLLLLVIDFWTFCAVQKDPLLYPKDRAGAPGPWRPFLPMRLYVDGHISLADAARAAGGGWRSVPNGVTRLGVTASYRDIGFGPDGSYYYGGFMRDVLAKSPLESRWELIYSRIDGNQDGFYHRCPVAQDRIERLARAIGRLEAAGVRVATIFAPQPGPVIERMNASGEYGYIDEMRAALAKGLAGAGEFFDYYDGPALGSGACEFLDGSHGGEVTHARLLLDVVARRPESALARRVVPANLRPVVETYAGRVAAATDPIGRAYRPELMAKYPDCG